MDIPCDSETKFKCWCIYKRRADTDCGIWSTLMKSKITRIVLVLSIIASFVGFVIISALGASGYNPDDFMPIGGPLFIGGGITAFICIVWINIENNK